MRDLCVFMSCLHLGSFLTPLSANIRILLCRLIKCMGDHAFLFFFVFDETFFSRLCANLFYFQMQGSKCVLSCAQYCFVPFVT
uniref:Secreted protein n=1 Tax=Rhipicephalus zambeziensis TaxID=60191 RepID=A0A224YAF5_9ACAR